MEAACKEKELEKAALVQQLNAAQLESQTEIKARLSKIA